MKMRLVSIFLFAIIAGSAYGEEREQIFSLDLDYTLTGMMNNGWGLGLYYEREVLPALSLKGGFGHMTLLDSRLRFEYTTVSVSLGADYYPFGRALRGGYCGVSCMTDFINYIGEEDSGEDGNRSVVSFLPHGGWKFHITDSIMIDLLAAYKFSPFGEQSRPEEAGFLNMGMRYRIYLKLFLM